MDEWIKIKYPAASTNSYGRRTKLHWLFYFANLLFRECPACVLFFSVLLSVRVIGFVCPDLFASFHYPIIKDFICFSPWKFLSFAFHRFKIISRYNWSNVENIWVSVLLVLFLIKIRSVVSMVIRLQLPIRRKLKFKLCWFFFR